MAVLAVGLVALLAGGALGDWWSSRIRVRDAVLAIALTALTVQLTA